jgi:siderophore synthetase component
VTYPLLGEPDVAANHAHLEALTRCWLREADETLGAALDVGLGGTRLRAAVTYRSATGCHRFGPFRLVGANSAVLADPPAAAGVAALMATERGGSARLVTELVGRTADSTRRTEEFLTVRGRESEVPSVVNGFLEAEQALLLGHLIHPTPKSREGLSPGQVRTFSPETRGRFRPHWFAADPSVVDHDAALVDWTAPGMAAELAEHEPDGRVLVPAHPWQAAEVVDRPGVRALLDAGLVEPLGPRGQVWWPTSSLRTVYRAGAPVMMKFSLGLRITNSTREHVPEFLRRGPEVHRLLSAGYANRTFAAHPGLTVVRDPAWLAIRAGDEPSGLEVTLRAVPDDIGDLRMLAGLLAPRPGRGPCRLVAARRASGLSTHRWVADYADLVLIPILHLYAATGIGLEAHQQNILIRLVDNRITGAAYRDNEGYYLARSHLPSVLRVTGRPGSDLAVTDDEVVDERLSYYLLCNQAFGVIAALGAEDSTPESELLTVLADRLRAVSPDLAAAGPDGDRLVRRWLSAPRLPCKANLLTRLRGIDEIRAPLDAQSVYLDVPNPLVSR